MTLHLQSGNNAELWTPEDTLDLFPHSHRNKIVLNNLGNTGFQTYLTSDHFAMIGMDNPEVFLVHCRTLFAIPQSQYLARRNLQRRFQRSDENVRDFVAELQRLVNFCGYDADEKMSV